MVNVFGGGIASGSGNLQVAKKVVVTVGRFKDYSDEIQQSYVLGFTPYRLQKNVDGTFVTPIRGKVYVLDDVATMEVSNRYLTTDTISSKLGDKGIQGSVGGNGDRDGRGERGVKGEKGIQRDNSDVLSVLAEHLPIQLATRYGETMCFINVPCIRG